MRKRQVHFIMVFLAGALVLAACGSSSAALDPSTTVEYELAPDFQLTHTRVRTY
ncbi:MAG: hypothetical protein IIC78_10335 [Chloroflexi bacterium]|nr:hypothetical protein [Chloroflexota bacterium]